MRECARMEPLRHAVSLDGTRIAFRATGSGDPIVFVHGSSTSSMDWALVAPHLSARFTVVTMDRRGRGESEDGSEYSIEREAEDVLTVLDAVEGDLLVGHSYGALCSILAATRTDRLRRLVLYEPPIAVREDRVPGAEALARRGELDALVELFLEAAGAPADQVELIRGSPAWPRLLDAARVLPRELEAAARWQHPSDPIEVPTLFLLGADTDGPVYLDTLGELHARFTDLRVERLPGQRHIAHVFAAEAFAGLVAQFLAS